jgi:quercetin dioxygenase-like cupin family protein
MTIPIANIDDLGFAPDGARLASVLEADNMRVLLLSLGEGQAVAPCQMSLTVLYLVLEGRGRLQVGDEESELAVGSLAIVPKDAVRSIQSETRMRVLAVQAP